MVKLKVNVSLNPEELNTMTLGELKALRDLIALESASATEQEQSELNGALAYVEEFIEAHDVS